MEAAPRRSFARRPSARWSLVGGAATLAGALTGLGACSLVGDLGATQCEVNADCVALGLTTTDGQDYLCAENVCIPPGDDAFECSSSDACYDRLGVDAICNPVSRACVKLAASELGGTPCNVVGYDPDHVGPYFVVGVLAPFKSEGFGEFLAVPTAKAAVDALDEAGIVEEVNQRTEVLAVVCDQSLQEEANAYLAWMSGELGAHAIITEQSSAQLAASYAEVDGLADHLVLATRNSDPSVHELDPGNMLFHLVGADLALAEAYGPLLEEAKARLGVSAGKSVILRRPSEMAGLAPAVYDIAQSADLAPVYNDYTVDLSNFNTTLTTVSSGIAVSSPDVILPVVGQAAISGVVLTYEIQHTSAKRPVYVLDPGGRYGQHLAVPEDMTPLPPVGRLFGAEHFTDWDAYQTYAGAVSTQSTALPAGYNLMYDAFLMLGLAAFRVSTLEGGDVADSTQLRDAVAAMDDGDEQLVLDSSSFNEAKFDLDGPDAAGITFRGTSGPVRWSPDGDRENMGVTAYCLVPDGSAARLRFGVPLDQVATICPPMP